MGRFEGRELGFRLGISPRAAGGKGQCLGFLGPRVFLFQGQTHVQSGEELGNVDDGKGQNRHGEPRVDRLLCGRLAVVFVDDVPQDESDGKCDHAARVLYVIHSKHGEGKGDIEKLDSDDVCSEVERS